MGNALNMVSAAEQRVRTIFAEAASAHIAAGERSSGLIASVANAMCDALERGKKILVFGNGGSAADAQHFAAELVGRFQRERQALSAVALTTDTSIITAIGNDYSYDQIFARQVEAIGCSGDVAFGISTSGRSPNVLAAFAMAKRRGLTTVALIGRDEGGADTVVCMPAVGTARIQELHRTALHAICELIEDRVEL